MYKLSDVARVTGLHNETIRRAARSGQLKADKVGKSYQVTRPDLIDYLNLTGNKLFIDMGGERFYSALGVSFELGSSIDTIQTLIDSGELKAKILDGKAWINEDNIKSYLNDSIQI